MKILLITLTILLLYSGCSRNIPSGEQRLKTIEELKDKQTIEKIYSTKKFNFFSVQTNLKECKNINVYFEGDGLAWITRSLISSNPTPINPIAFKLMNIDNSKCKIYLARACQYVDSQNCNKKDWTSHRFSRQIVNSTNEVIDQLKKDYQNDNFTFIGYSGGGAIASLIANQRVDVKTLITVAGNLDTTLWTKIKRLTPLDGSLNPVDYTNNLQYVKQYHLTGTNDSVIPIEVTQSYMNKFSNKQNINYKIFDASHSKGWEKSYKEFLKEITNE